MDIRQLSFKASALWPLTKHAKIFDPHQRPVLKYEEDMVTNILAHKCLFRTSEIAATIRVESDAYSY